MEIPFVVSLEEEGPVAGPAAPLALPAPLSSGLSSARTSVGDTASEVVLSVTALTRRIQKLLEGQFASVTLRGEISNLRRPQSGHLYFQLKDAESQLRGIMFRNMAALLRFDLEDGLEVQVQGKIGVYGRQGTYQIQVLQMQPLGIGTLQLRFEQSKKRLQAAGFFDRARKRKLPFLPRGIGIVTSASGAAIQDILQILRRRCPSVPVLLCAASVQGDQAAEQIARGIAALNAYALAADSEESAAMESSGAESAARASEASQRRVPLDVLIVGRGGGSMEDLWAFNEEVVAQAILTSRLPLISAVGHEIDVTIADFVADVRAPTPSAAAELVVPAREALLVELEGRANRLQRAQQQRLSRQRHDLEQSTRRLQRLHPLQQVRQRRASLAVLDARLRRTIGQQLAQRRTMLVGRESVLQALGPQQIIDRGYAVVRDGQGRLCMGVEQLRVGDRFDVQMRDGTIRGRAERLDPTRGEARPSVSSS